MKKPYYICFHSNIPVFQEEEIYNILLAYANNNTENIEVVNEIISYFEFMSQTKKGEKNEVVLKGSEILEAILFKNVE